MTDRLTEAEVRLAREVLALMGERDEARAVLRELEWNGNYDGDDSCPICAVDETHAPDCRLARALGDTP